MSLSVNVSGAWKNASAVHTRVNGTWRKVTQVWVRVNGSWKQVWSGSGFRVVANLNGPRIWHYTEAAYGYVYVIGGYSSVMDYGYENTTTERYDPATNTWAYMANNPYRKVNGCSFVIDNKIYVQGGNGQYYQGVIYNPATNTYGEYKQTRAGESQFSGAINGYGYTAGGLDGFVYNNTYQYNPTTNTSTLMAAMPTALAYGASAAVFNSLFTFGGMDINGNWTNLVYQYTPSNNTWTQKASAPSADQRPCAWSFNNKIYLYRLWNQLDIFDPATNTWVTSADRSPSGQSIYGTKAAVVGNKAYIPGGMNANNGSFSNQTLEYTMG